MARPLTQRGETLRGVLGVAEIAALLDMQPGTISVLRSRGQLPGPDARLAVTDLWLQDTIIDWAEQTGRI